ncbi:uncharacterized protein LOC102303241 [Haplochromis burtoni]|uniref:uncharacterized protein LOC102303241 n=1 Tax=Haplochromis burtoni TaxID=8153 RepID=UPI0003BC76DF|nr:uncharacterized protein LOC102303241 [Haplochromis burtoni]
MKVCQALLCFIFLNLQDGNTGLANAETLVYEGVEGGNITVECKFYILGRKTLFCKDECEKGNVLIETPDYTAQSGRYRIKYEKNYFSKDIVHVSITQLKKSDSGWYRCTLDTTLQPCDFKIFVKEVSMTTTRTTTIPDSGFSLHLVVSITVVVVLLPVALLLIYRKWAGGSFGLNSRRHSEQGQTEISLSERYHPVSSCEDSIYQSLNMASRDHDQIYSTLRHNNQFSDMSSCQTE